MLIAQNAFCFFKLSKKVTDIALTLLLRSDKMVHIESRIAAGKGSGRRAERGMRHV